MMKKIIYIVTLLLLIMAACSDGDEKLTQSIDLSSPYVITEDNPKDPIQHKVYQLYKEYSVPVFFKDTIQKSLMMYDYEGNPVYKYETLDLRWRFTSYQHDVNYNVKELTTQKEQLEALNFVEYYLQMVSKQMRPFCIYAVKSFMYDKTSSKTIPYLVGFRTLSLAGIDTVTDEAKKQEMCISMIRAMVLDKVKQNTEVYANFSYISQKNNWYDSPWINKPTVPGLGCSYEYTAINSLLNPTTMFTKEEQFLKDVKSIIFDKNPTEFTKEKAFEIRRNIMKDIGQFGFICGSKNAGAIQSPEDSSIDLEFYVTTMVTIGDAEFKVRYGESPLVMQKYKILYDYIVNKLGVDLINI